MLNNNSENIDDFVVKNLKLYHYLINKICKYDENIEEIREYGLIFYLRACKNYDKNQKIKFSAYLSRTIYNTKINYYSRSYEYKNQSKTLSIDCPIPSTGDENLSYIDLLTYKTEKFETPQNHELIKSSLQYINQNYDEKQKIVFFNHLKGINQEENALLCGCSQATVSRIIRRIQKDLKKQYGEFNNIK